MGKILNIYLSIVIPVYRSENSIEELIRSIILILGKEQYNYEIIAVCDGSPDSVWEKLKTLCKDRPKLRAILLKENYGQQAAILCGLLHAKGQYILTIDDDLEYHPQLITRMLHLIETSDAGLIYGYAHNRKQGIIRLVLSPVIKILMRIFAGIPLRQSSLRIMKRSVCARLKDNNANYFLIDQLLLRQKPIHLYINVPHRKRKYGKSNYSIRRLTRLWFCYFISASKTGEFLSITLLMAGIALLLFQHLLFALIVDILAFLILWMVYVIKWKERISYKIIEQLNF